MTTNRRQKRCPRCKAPEADLTLVDGRPFDCGRCGWDRNKDGYPDKKGDNGYEKRAAEQDAPLGRGVRDPGPGPQPGLADEGERGGHRVRPQPRTTGADFHRGLVACLEQLPEDRFVGPVQRRILEVLYREAIHRELIYRIAGSAWLETQTGIKARHVRDMLHRLEELGWLKIIPLADMRTKHFVTWQHAKGIQAKNGGGRAPTIVELRSNPDTPTAWIRTQEAA